MAIDRQASNRPVTIQSETPPRGGVTCRTSRRTGWDWLAKRGRSTRDVAAGLVAQVEPGLLGHLPVRQAQRVCTQSRPIFYSLPRRRCYARHGVDRPASRQAGAALPASTSSLAQHGCAAALISRQPPHRPPLARSPTPAPDPSPDLISPTRSVGGFIARRADRLRAARAINDRRNHIGLLFTGRPPCSGIHQVTLDHRRDAEERDDMRMMPVLVGRETFRPA